jgi:hypothetical protein
MHRIKFNLEGIIKNEDTQYEDLKRSVKGELTDFINEYFLTYNTNQIKLIKTIYNYINPVLKSYNIPNLKLIFKGGNVMNIISNNIIKFFTNDSDKIINKFFKPFLKKSDNDFTILLNPNTPNYEMIYYDISKSVFYALNKIRNQIEENPKQYFEIYNYDEKKINTLFYDLLLKLNGLEDAFIKPINSIKLNKLNDKLIELKNNKNIVVYGSEYYNYYYNSLNRSLIFKDVNDNIIKFVLLRTKLNFLLNKTYNIGGELIDISMPHKDDHGINILNTNDKFNNFIKENVSEFTQNGINYNIININYIVHDLYKILFIANKYAWDDTKYKKRLIRYIFFIFLDLVNNHPISKESLIKIKKCFSTDLTQCESKDLNNLYKKMEEYVKDKKINKEKLNEFMVISKEYIKLIIDIIDKIIIYLDGKIKIDDIELYKINIK